MTPITFLTRGLDYGGAERQLLLLAEELCGRGYPVKILAFYEGKMANAKTHPHLNIQCLGKKSRWDMFGFLWRLYKTLRQEVLVYSFLTVPNILAVCLKGRGVVMGVRASNMDYTQYDWLAGLTSHLERLVARRASGIITNSWAGLECIKGYNNPHKRVVPNGVDPARFYPRAKHSKLAIGIIGRIDPMKGYPIFIEAARIVLESNPKARFMCVGDGDPIYKKQLKEKALGLPFEWVENQSNVEEIYGALDLLVSASIYGEGMSNVLLEALASGVPCVATDVGDARHIVDSDCIVPPNDVKALAKAILKAPKSIKPDTRFTPKALGNGTLEAFKDWGLL